MRVLVIGAGGVGSSAALIAARRDFFESWLIADYDGDRARELADRVGVTVANLSILGGGDIA